MADADVSRTPTLAMHGSTSEPEPQEKQSVEAAELEKGQPTADAAGAAAVSAPAADDDPEGRYVTGKKLAIIFA
jgi:hypothetical protein